MHTHPYKYTQAIPTLMTIPTYLYHNRPFVHTHRHIKIPQATMASWILRIMIICHFVFLVQWTKQTGAGSQGRAGPRAQPSSYHVNPAQGWQRVGFGSGGVSGHPKPKPEPAPNSNSGQNSTKNRIPRIPKPDG